MKARAFHSALSVFVLHELFPYEAGAVIFRHQHGDAEINTKDVGVAPTSQGIEGIHEAVFRPRRMLVGAAKVPQNAETIAWKKRQRTARGARHDAAIHWPERFTLCRRAAPRGVAVHIIRSADAPQIFAVIRKAIAKRKAKELVCFRGFDGVLEIVRVRVALFSEIKPRVRILMREDGIVSGDVLNSLILYDRARPGIPGAWHEGMSWRTHGQ